MKPVLTAGAVLVVCVDLGVVAATDQDLDRVGLISGASVYPLVWNMLLAARNEGFGGTITTMAVAPGAGGPGAARHPGAVRRGRGASRSASRSSSPRSCAAAGRGVRDPGAVRRRAVRSVSTARQVLSCSRTLPRGDQPAVPSCPTSRSARRTPATWSPWPTARPRSWITAALHRAYPDALVLGEEATASDLTLRGPVPVRRPCVHGRPGRRDQELRARLSAARRDGRRAARRRRGPRLDLAAAATARRTSPNAWPVAWRNGERRSLCRRARAARGPRASLELRAAADRASCVVAAGVTAPRWPRCAFDHVLYRT